MPCIGQMERFHPFPFAGAAPDCPTIARRLFTRAAFRISALPKLRHPDRTMGPAGRKSGAMGGGGGMGSGRPNCSNRNTQKPRKTAHLRGINHLEAAETLAFSHCTTRKPAA